MQVAYNAEQLDIRDIESGEVYYSIASKENGGRCILTGMFPAVWRDKAAAKLAANGNPDLTVVKCLRP